MQQLIGVREAAALLGISRWTLRGLVAHGRVPVVRLCRRLLFDPAQLEELVRSRTVPVSPEPAREHQDA